MILKTVIGLLVFAIAVGVLVSAVSASPLARDLTYTQNKDSVDVLKDGVPVARYVYGGYFPHLNLLGKKAGEQAGELQIATISVGHGNLEATSFVAASKVGGTIKQTALSFDSIEPGYWNIHASNEWVRAGKVICREDRRHSFVSSPDGLVVSTMITLFPADGDLHIGYSDEGFFLLRQSNHAMDSRLTNSLGDKDNKAILQRAQWLLLRADIMGKPYSFALFDLPANYGFPAQWNGVVAANPFAKWKGRTGKYALTIPDLGAEAFVYVCLVAPGELSVDRVKAFARERLRVPEEKIDVSIP